MMTEPRCDAAADASRLFPQGLPKDLQDFLLYGLVMAASDQAAAEGGEQPSSSSGQPLISAADGKARPPPPPPPNPRPRPRNLPGSVFPPFPPP